MGDVRRYDHEEKKKIDVECLYVIKIIMVGWEGVHKSDMLTHLYKTALRANRWYIHIFGYTIDVSVAISEIASKMAHNQ